MKEGSSVQEHIIQMHGYGERLFALGFAIPYSLSIDVLLDSLLPSYGGFIMNYNMNGMNKSTNELFAMLKTPEPNLQKEPNHVMMVNKATSFKKMGKAHEGKNNGNGKRTNARGKRKDSAQPETMCFHCKGKGHWKRNYKKYLAKKEDIRKVWSRYNCYTSY
jgi:hypothetical protein